MEAKKRKPHRLLALLLCGLVLAGLYCAKELWQLQQDIDEIWPDSSREDILLVNPWTPLPEDYATGTLVLLDNGQKVAASCYEALASMLADCRAAGHAPYVCSGYRSETQQRTLYETKVKHFIEAGYNAGQAAAEAGKIVAVPGTSEHQTGLAVDLIDSEYTYLDEGQANTGTQQWLMDNCWRYGFILRYPEGKSELTGIIYEPWHYRYVGAAAEEITEKGLCLEEYLQGNG